MPNPATMNSLQPFEREHINAVIHVPDYKLRRQISLEQKEPLVVEAFSAFEEMYYLHLRWTHDVKHPDFYLTVTASQYQHVVFDLAVQSPYFTYIPNDESQAHTAPQWSTCNWATSPSPVEVKRTITTVPLYIDRQPSQHNDETISFDQTMTLTIVGTLWKLERSRTDSLWCLSYRTRMLDTSEPATDEFLPRMIANIAAMKDTGSVDDDICGMDGGVGSSLASITDIVIELDESDQPQRTVHAFILKAHSPVFRRMLDGSMSEASDRRIHMKSVSTQELEDFLSCLYQLHISKEVQDDEDRLMSLMALADRYEVLALRDECAALLVSKLSEANMAAILKVADMHQAVELKAAAVRFICSRQERIVSVMDTDDTNLRKNVREYIQAAKMMPVPVPGEVFLKRHRQDYQAPPEIDVTVANASLTI